MLKKIRKTASVLLVSSMLLSVGTPVEIYAADIEYIVSEQDLDANGTLILKEGTYTKITIPEGLSATNLLLQNVTVDELVVEGGLETVIEISGGSIAKVQMERIKEEMPNLRMKAQLLKAGNTLEEATAKYQSMKQEVAEKQNKTPELSLKDNATVKAVSVEGNAKLNLAEGKTESVTVTAKGEMQVVVDGFQGSLVIQQDKETTTKQSSTLNLELHNSKVEKTEIQGGSKTNLVISGTDSSIAQAVVSGSGNLVLDVATEKLEATKESKDIQLVVLGTVEEVVLNGENANMNLAKDAVVKTATVNGDGSVVGGSGKLEMVVTENETVQVEVKDTQVKTPEEAEAMKPTVTPKPTAAATTKPTATPRPTSTPWVPTVAPTKAPEVTVTPTPTETPNVTSSIEIVGVENNTVTITENGVKAYELKVVYPSEAKEVAVIATSPALNVVTAEVTEKNGTYALEVTPISNGEAEIDVILSCDGEEKVTTTLAVTVNISSSTPEVDISMLQYDKKKDGTIKITGVTDKTLTEIIIPEKIDGCIVTEIGDSAFSDCSSLTSIDLPDSIMEIGNGAFFDCSSLKGINLPDGVTTIGSNAFFNCSSLENVALKNVTSTRSAVATGSVAEIGGGAFRGCVNLTSVELPDNVTTIDTQVFFGCSSLTSISWPDNLIEIGSEAFYACSSLTSIDLPDNVTTIGNNAFAGCESLTSINFSDNLTTIDNGAFSYCYGLTSISLPDSVTTIGICAFDSCSSLASINLPDNLTTLGEAAFADCSASLEITVTRDSNAEKLAKKNGYEKMLKYVD